MVNIRTISRAIQYLHEVLGKHNLQSHISLRHTPCVHELFSISSKAYYCFSCVASWQYFWAVSWLLTVTGDEKMYFICVFPYLSLISLIFCAYLHVHPGAWQVWRRVSSFSEWKWEVVMIFLVWLLLTTELSLSLIRSLFLL